MKIHILGICGTFMGSLAVLATKLGMQVSGQDSKVYPPMSTLLQEQNITIIDGYAIADIPSDVDIIVIGNVMRRGMEIIEYVLDRRLSYMSGPEFLEQHVLRKQHVLVVAGTHGKTTTSSILTWILHYAGLNPGYLIGGVPNNFGISADIGDGKYFVIEGDEYDCAFFDKRSKFLHYCPQTLILNNIEYDHADIFPNLDAILTQFNHLLRIVPNNGLVVYRDDDANIANVLNQGCWTPKESFALKNADWTEDKLGIESLPLSLLGEHNRMNALAAMAAAQHVGVPPNISLMALHEFTGVKRRLEIKGKVRDITVYSDFAHHPTAIKTTLAGLRSLIGSQNRIVALVDICSNTMKAGIHQDTLAESVADAQLVYFYHATDLTWNVRKTWADTHKPGGVYQVQIEMLEAVLEQLQPGDYVLLMSNGSFEVFAQNLLQKLGTTLAKAAD